eukprot:TRINITY_DN6055_c0_g1_i1.p1 TRINITY_DN6055_c0_g1~~TRINITY_DN6055_c0_g1_i1.p1  ORF type:complete len:158 (-),score=31.42 TRINITY_DN6055_c0_g1_i1:22-495(-)
MLGLGADADADAVAPGSAWVDAGIEQLIVPLRSEACVHAVQPVPALLALQRSQSNPSPVVYVFAATSAEQVVARGFFLERGCVVEDAATGSACANLGGWLVANGTRQAQRTVMQGQQVGRPSQLNLAVTPSAITVSGRVVAVGHGVFTLGLGSASKL